MKHALTFTAAAILCCCALLFGCSPLVAAEKSVVVGFDSNFADTTPWSSADPSDTGEAVHVLRWVWSLGGESVIKMQDYTDDSAWINALTKSKVVIFIENEEGSDSSIKAALSEQTRTAIRDWVRNNGSTVVFCSGDLEPAQILTGLNFLDRKRGEPIRDKAQRGLGGDGSLINKTADGEASDLFASAPYSLVKLNACNSWYLDNELPTKRSGSLQCMYGTTSSCYLWRYADGEGAWYGVGPDFYDWGYPGGQDGGWEAVMKIVIDHKSSAAQLSHWIQWLAALLL